MYLAAHFLSLWPGLALHLVFPHLAGQLFFISGYSHTQGESRCERQLKDQPRFKSSRQRLHIVRGIKVYVSRRKIINDNSLWSYLCKKSTVTVTATLLISLIQRFLKEPQLFILNHRAIFIWIKDEQRNSWVSVYYKKVAVMLYSAQNQMFQAVWDLRSPFESTGSSVWSPILFY